MTRKKTLLAEKERLQAYLQDTDKRVENWLDVAERGFSFAEKAQEMFAKARTEEDLKLKMDVFTALGSNYTLKDRKLSITLDNLLSPIAMIAKDAREISARFEPTKNAVDTGQLAETYAKSPRWLADLDDVRTLLPSHTALIRQLRSAVRSASKDAGFNQILDNIRALMKKFQVELPPLPGLPSSSALRRTDRASHRA